MRRALLPALICLLLLTLPSAAMAFKDASKVFAAGSAGLGGEFDGELSGDVVGFRFGEDIDGEDMESSLGGMLHYETPVHKWVSVGGRVSFGSFIDEARADEDWSRNLLLNLDVVPKLRYGLPDMPGEVYLALPIGPSLVFPSDDWEDEEGVEFDTGVSWNVSFLIGADYMLFDQLALFAELGWTLQNVALEGTHQLGDVELDGSFGQFALNLGVALPL